MQQTARIQTLSIRITYIISLGLLLFQGQLTKAATFMTQPVTTSISETSTMTAASGSSVGYFTLTSLSSLPPVSRITQPPSLTQLELRQRCWNDQGFSVDCAVWTGYRYTWGPATNPNDYWSGAGGSRGGGGLVSSDAPKPPKMRISIAATLALLIGASLCGMVHY